MVTATAKATVCSECERPQIYARQRCGRCYQRWYRSRLDRALDDEATAAVPVSGSELRALRERAGLSIEDAAALLDVEDDTYRRMESALVGASAYERAKCCFAEKGT